MQTEEPSFYAFLSYVTLREAWAETKTQFGVWLFLSIFFVVSGSLGVIGADAVHSWVGEDVPKWLWWVAVFCGMSWFMRGEEVKFQFPKLTFPQWLVSSFLVLLFGWAFAVLPFWASAPIWLGLVVGAGAVDELSLKGKENYLKLHSPAAPADDSDYRGPQ